jgi:hypothetical protein
MAAEKSSKPLEKMTVEELLDLRNKQELLLGNKSLVAKLPDRGEKVRATLDKIQTLLSSKHPVGPRANDSKLHDVLAAMEWRVRPVAKEDGGGEEEEASDSEEEGVCDGPDAEEKTLKMLAAVGRPLEEKKRTKTLPQTVSVPFAL